MGHSLHEPLGPSLAQLTLSIRVAGVAAKAAPGGDSLTTPMLAAARSTRLSNAASTPAWSSQAQQQRERFACRWCSCLACSHAGHHTHAMFVCRQGSRADC